jgi:hypothetical protein
MPRPSVRVMGPSRRPGGQRGKAIFLDGSLAEITFRDLNPSHDPALGVFYTGENGSRWKPVHENRMAPNGEFCGGPGWFEPLEDEELPEDE